MEIAMILFTYNRPYHTEKVLEALKRNDSLPSKLYIFQDGLKENTNEDDWTCVGKVIKQVNWCDAEIHIADRNRGLAESIVSGVTYVFENYDAVIVLEDDCVPHPKFMKYMVSGLRKYKDIKQVYSVDGGGTWPMNMNTNKEDAFFCGRISSTGWGTWRDRWVQYERNYMILNRIKANPQARERLNIWGRDLENQLIGNVTGDCDSWAVFWALKVIEKGGYCLRPYESLITNIGCDGTGVHSGAAQIDTKIRAIDNMDDFILPDTILYNAESMEVCKELLSGVSAVDRLSCYRDILALWVKMKQKGKCIHRLKVDMKASIAIWGKGQLCDLLLQEWEHHKEVKYIIESTPSTQQYAGIPVISFEELPSDIKNIVVIPVYDIERIKRKIEASRIDVKIIGIDELIANAENDNSAKPVSC